MTGQETRNDLDSRSRVGLFPALHRRTHHL